MIAKIYVSPKRTVLDPQGKVVQSGLHNLGYETVREVRVGKYIELELLGEEGQTADLEATIDEMCRRFLANPIIEDYRFELVP